MRGRRAPGAHRGACAARRPSGRVLAEHPERGDVRGAVQRDEAPAGEEHLPAARQGDSIMEVGGGPNTIVFGLPTVIMLDKAGNEIVRFNEFVPPEKFVAAMKKVPAKSNDAVGMK